MRRFEPGHLWGICIRHNWCECAALDRGSCGGAVSPPLIVTANSESGRNGRHRTKKNPRDSQDFNSLSRCGGKCGDETKKSIIRDALLWVWVSHFGAPLPWGLGSPTKAECRDIVHRTVGRAASGEYFDCPPGRKLRPKFGGCL